MHFDLEVPLKRRNVSCRHHSERPLSSGTANRVSETYFEVSPLNTKLPRSQGHLIFQRTDATSFDTHWRWCGDISGHVVAIKGAQQQQQQQQQRSRLVGASWRLDVYLHVVLEFVRGTRACSLSTQGGRLPATSTEDFRPRSCFLSRYLSSL